MILAYTGVPGGGKSLHAAQDILDSVRLKGVPVIANFDVNRAMFERSWFRRKELAEFRSVRNTELNPQMLIDYAKQHYRRHDFHEHGILLVIDEAQLIFNARNWNEAGRDDWVYFFTNSRHFGYKVVLICQFLEMLDKQIRSVIEVEVRHRNMANFGLAGKLISLCVGGKLFACVTYYVGLRQRIGVQYVFGRRHLYGFYDSYDVESFAVE